ncbi:lymphocyte antigen 75-like [Silurus meridionalis]|nr:lymphocyte antigen 75-like [Silurus meridionalis]
MQIFVHKYYLIKTNVTWQAAQNYCRETYDDLATVETDLDWLILKKELAAQGLNDVVWVGLYNDSDSWRWAFNDIPMKNTFSHWNTEQPDNLGGNQACCLSGPLGYWWDYTCTLLFPFICFNANISAAGRYVGVTSAMNWSDAHAYCQEFHTDLAVLSSTEENDRMQSIAYVQGRSWIGLYRDTWKWSDGTNTSSLMWLAGQPDNYYQNENCAVLNNGWFNDVKCHQLHYFICHTTHLLRKQQTVKLKVKSSDESVTDSDMQSAISELIKMKLDKNGMLENTTVTWRVQSDGQVFQK